MSAFYMLPYLLFVSLKISKQFTVHKPYKAHCLQLQSHKPISSTQTLYDTLPTFTATYTNFQYTPYKTHSLHLQPHTPISSAQTL